MVDRIDGPDGESRYRLLETIREYAADRLVRDGVDGEREAVGRRHSQMYADLVTQSPPSSGPEHADWLARIGAEQDNIRLTLERALTGGGADLALSVAGSMWWYWWVTGQMLQGRAYLDRALEATLGEISARRGQALRAAASLARNSGDLAAARDLGQQALDTFRRLDQTPGIVAALNNLCITAQAQSDYDASLAFGYEALRLAQQTGDDRATAAALNNTAGTLRCLGRLDEAAGQFTRALNRFRHIADRRGEAAALFNLATVDRRQHRPELSRERYLQALALYTDLTIVEGQLDALEGLAHLDALAGQHRAALVALLVCKRERARLNAPLFTPDEIDDLAQAQALSRAGVPEDALPTIVRAAESTTLRQLPHLASATSHR
jgi:tetratricopeptide (TPR) repeat protein